MCMIVEPSLEPGVTLVACTVCDDEWMLEQAYDVMDAVLVAQLHAAGCRAGGGRGTAERTPVTAFKDAS